MVFYTKTLFNSTSESRIDSKINIESVTSTDKDTQTLPARTIVFGALLTQEKNRIHLYRKDTKDRTILHTGILRLMENASKACPYQSYQQCD